jgi:carboxypeptidase family protein
MRTLAVTAALLAALASPALLRAQETASLAIHVVDASDAPVAGARLELVGTRFAGVSDNAGWVRMQGLPVGPALLRVSRIGYAPLETSVPLSAGAPFEADVELVRAPVAVNPVTASATRANAGLAGTGFYARKERGFGVFVTREEMERSHALRTSDVFRRMAGVRLVPVGPHSYQLQSERYGGMGLSQTGAFSRPRRTADGGVVDPRMCPMATFVDGVQVQLDDIDEVVFNNLGAVEVYRGPSEIPPEFNQTTRGCGVVVMWTRTAEPNPAAAASSTPAPAQNPAG